MISEQAKLTILGWTARVAWLTGIILLIVFIAYSDIYSTSEYNASSGGVNACFYCPNSWNWHVILLTLAFVVAMTEASLAFVAPVIPWPSTYKWIHAGWQTAAVAFTIAGMIAIVQSKEEGGYKMMYSVHAWTGAVVLFFFALQYLVGVSVYVFFKGAIASPIRQSIGVWHAWGGKLLVIAGLGVCVNGWADMQMMMVDFGQWTYGSATMLQSAIPITIGIVGICTTMLLFHSTTPSQRAGGKLSSDLDKSQEDIEVHAEGAFGKAAIIEA